MASPPKPAGGEPLRRADRLFEIIQILRRKPTVRARDIAEALEISERTVYRDIRDLMASGVPIEGEAGVGYVLRAGFDLPPLMFKESEIEALVLGARIVESWADRELVGGGGGRDRQDRGGDPRPAARVYGEHGAAGAAVAFHGADPVRSRGPAAGGPEPDQGAFRLCGRAGAGERADGAAAVAGLFRAGVGAGGVVRAEGGFPDVPAGPDRRVRGAGGAFPRRGGEDAARLPEAQRHLDAERAQPERAG